MMYWYVARSSSGGGGGGGGEELHKEEKEKNEKTYSTHARIHVDVLYIKIRDETRVKEKNDLDGLRLKA